MKRGFFCVLKRALFELFDELIHALQFAGDVDLLRAVGHTLAALCAMVCLAKAGHTAVVAYEERPSCLLVVLRLLPVLTHLL